MSGRELDYWFLVQLPESTKVTYLVLAPSTEKAREKMGLFSEGRILRHVTWQEIVAITGCKKPDKAKQDDYAKGGLLIEHKTRWFYLWTGVNLEL